MNREDLRKIVHRNRARAMRKKPTPAEAAMWRLLRHRDVGGFKFRRQHPWGPYILNFFCHRARLVIELDGEHHHDDPEQLAQDRERDAELNAHGFALLRFPNSVVLTNPDLVREQILKVLRARG